MKCTDVREQLVYALRDDLIGPDSDDPRDAVHLTETLEVAPSQWYLTGFLVPTGQKSEDKEDPEAGEELMSGLDDPSEGDAEAVVARRPLFPSSIGLSVLVREDCNCLSARVTYGTYHPEPAPLRPASGQEGSSPPPPDDMPLVRYHWTRTPHEHKVEIPLDGRPRLDIPLPDSKGLVLRVFFRPVPDHEWELVPKGTRYVTAFLVNERAAVDRPETDRGFVFQTQLSLECEKGFVPRPNLRGGDESDDIDERIGDLQFRDCFEYGVGHGISVHSEVRRQGEKGTCPKVSTTWIPVAEVEKVVPSAVAGVELRMPALAEVQDGASLIQAVGGLVSEYGKWIAEQAVAYPDLTQARKETAEALLDAARHAKERIARGIAVLEGDPNALEAFRLANRVMAAAQTQRELQKSPDRVKSGKFVPTWRPFQLAFLLMNIAGQVDPKSSERDAVDLIFFPTGGGKTEAYLGLAAFTLVLRRLTNPGRLSAGVTVLMRYTLRLLTLDQYERAATLICALEIERRKDPQKLGPQRFSIGLWVGQAATPNRFGTEGDNNENSAVYRVNAFSRDPSRHPSPIPIDRCPWCGEPFGQTTFAIKPDTKSPQRLQVGCTRATCAFRVKEGQPGGIPVLAVDEEIYRELPCFLIATVDKFAGLPWMGQSGLLLGRNVTHYNEAGFYGPAGRAPGAKPLERPLLPPELIIQDELHLISGPLGTMVGLYETAIDYLSTRVDSSGPEPKRIRPKIVASTATVRRAQVQIQALFGRDRVDVFPPPGPSRRDSFFAHTEPSTEVNARKYIGLAAPGRSMKVILMRSYIALLAAAQKAYEQDKAAADPYMSLVGYFNSLRELGGSQRIVEDEVRARLQRIDLRHRLDESNAYLARRQIAYECVELTSRRSTDEIKETKARLEKPYAQGTQVHPPVDVALASNMISVGVDISRLGLMVVCGQPKTTAEYIQSSSRVGRDDQRPGLVVTLLNVHKPRDRSHYEHFWVYHESFYRGVEATSVTPFSPRAIDRGLAALVVALARLGNDKLTAPDNARQLPQLRPELGFIGEVLAARLEAHRRGHDENDPIDEAKATLQARVESLLDSWTHIVQDDPASAGLAYQKHEDQAAKRPLLRMPMDKELPGCDRHEKKFIANRSMRDVESTTDLYVVKIKDSRILREGTEQ